MLKNYIIISFRNLKKHSGFSMINIVGLGLGIATCLLLVMWIMHETSYDTFHENHKRIYRGSMEYSFGGEVARTSVSPNALLPALLTFPETETGVRIYNAAMWNLFVVRHQDNFFHEKKFYFADSTFFDVFSFSLLKGNPRKALTEPNTVVLTVSSAKKYFGNEDPIGKTLQINNAKDYLVTGVMNDVPSNSLLQFDFVASFNSLQAGRSEPIWWNANYQTFFVLKDNSSLDALHIKTNDLVMKVLANEITGTGDYVNYNFILLEDIYLKSDFSHEPEVVSSVKYIYIFGAIALLILFIACINYVNLTTARATERAKEVGIRKVAGALKNQLFIQFIGESLIVTLSAFMLALGIITLAMPFFNELTGKNFTIDFMLAPEFFVSISMAVIVIGLLAGAYPALAITAFKPVTILKGNFKNSGRGVWLRKSLVVLQFSITVILIAGTLVINNQLIYMQDVKLGYDKENIIELPLDDETHKVYDSFKSELLKSGAVKNVCLGSSSPTLVAAGYSIATADRADRGVIITGLIIDEDYIPTLGMEMLYGANFTTEDVERIKNKVDDGFILNETAVNGLGLDPEKAIGKPLIFNDRNGVLKGIVKDFHFSSLHHGIAPLVMFIEPQNLSKVLVRLQPGNVQENLATVSTIASALLPHRPFDFSFLDQQYARMYDAEQRMSAIFFVFAILAIIIACLGLLGLVAYAAIQKTKEIGIRKVLGASEVSIVKLITKDFINLVLISILIGIPLSWYIMDEWLNGFAYKTTVGLLPLVIAAVVSLIIALLTAGIHAFKAALVNPSETLRSE